MSGSDPIRSVDRALGVLELLAHEPDGMRLSEIAAGLDVKAPTAHNLLRTLASRDYVVRMPRPVRYRLGPRILSLGRSLMRSELCTAALPVLRSLSLANPRAVITLTQVIGSDLLTVLRCDRTAPGVVQRPQNLVLSPYATASGLLFQAYAGAEELAAFRAGHPFWEQGAALWRDPERLEEALRTVRRRGYALKDFPGEGIWAIGAPVFDTTGLLAAAVGGALPDCSQATDRERLKQDVLSAALRLSVNKETTAC